MADAFPSVRGLTLAYTPQYLTDKILASRSVSASPKPEPQRRTC